VSMRVAFISCLSVIALGLVYLFVIGFLTR
jgi:hypothetical protein